MLSQRRVQVQVNDADQNVDSSLIDTIDVRVRSANGDVETLRLSETAPDSGRFVGYIQTNAAAANAADCVLQVERNSSVESFYVDAEDPDDRVQASALVDPFGVVFDSRTGAPLNGARVRLVNAASGANAVVYGDDGFWFPGFVAERRRIDDGPADDPWSELTAEEKLEQVIFGVLIIMFLIFEPLGFARLWQLTKERLRLWPFRR